MRPTTLSLALAATLVSLAPPVSAQTTVPVRFRAHDIARIQGGYAVAVADFNGDNRIDVMVNSVGAGRDVAWYQNPSWRRVVIVPRRRGW
jgi:short-subunit dehydrogenase